MFSLFAPFRGLRFDATRLVASRLLRLRLFAFAVLGAAASALPVLAANGEAKTSPDANRRPKRVYQATRLTGPAPVIDGRLDDACWRTLGSWSGGYTQFTPYHGAPPSHPTEIKILYDDRNLYVAIRAADGPIATRSRHPGDRDEFSGDIVGVTFDSYHDKRSAFEFDLTSAGQKIDLRLFNSSWDTTWNAVWDGKVSQDAKGWYAEFLIPLSQVRYVQGNDVWGLHSWRWIDSKKEEDDWNLIANDDSGIVQSFGELHGMAGLKVSRRIEVTPYVSAKAETFGHRDGEAAQSGRMKLDAGLDAKIGLTSNLTLDASLLPDFGQLDADPSVMNLTAFETFLEERRPFFLEGNDIFKFPFDEDAVFYSRRIGQSPSFWPSQTVLSMPGSATLLGALKLSGKTSQGLALGVLGCETESESAEVIDNGVPTSVGVVPRTDFLVARAQQEFRGGDTLVGGIVTRTQRYLDTPALRDAVPSQATVVGADLMHYWASREYFLQAVVVHSRVTGAPASIEQIQLDSARYFQRPIDGVSHVDPTRDSLEGTGLWLKAGRGSRGHWRYNEQFIARTPGLDFNDLGYLSIADRMSQRTEVSYVDKTPSALANSITLTASHQNEWTTRGEFLRPQLKLQLYSELRNKGTLSATLQGWGAGRDPIALRGGPMLWSPGVVSGYFWYGTDPSRRVFASLWGNLSRAQDASYRDSGLGVQLSARPCSPLLVSLSVERTNQTDLARSVAFSNPDGSAAASSYVARGDGQSLSFAFRAQWIIRPELRIQYYGSPFGSVLRHTDYRRVTAPLAHSAAARFSSVLGSTLQNGTVILDDGMSASNPDWNSGQFRSNLVLKWDYRRGSTLYLVWAQQRDTSALDTGNNARSSLGSLWNIAPDNQVMVKLTYWFSS
ncbi:hypothetical protein GALL_293350 [mine drainage metagenome]|uniref:Uncharacterized protein n=1 Tax=mine drainage metagenome TaxID=410659 RepID=A0A1J5R9I8_9ZZZZ